MRIGGVELYLNNPLVLIGSTEPDPGDLTLTNEAAVASKTHLLVASKANLELVPVRLWLHEGVGEGETVFDGILDLADGRIAIGDHAGLWRFVAMLHKRGPVHVVVTVDEVCAASSIDVFVEPDS
jgi:hypothetical protein